MASRRHTRRRAHAHMRTHLAPEEIAIALSVFYGLPEESGSCWLTDDDQSQEEKGPWPEKACRMKREGRLRQRPAASSRETRGKAGDAPPRSQRSEA